MLDLPIMPSVDHVDMFCGQAGHEEAGGNGNLPSNLFWLHLGPISRLQAPCVRLTALPTVQLHCR